MHTEVQDLIEQTMPANEHCHVDEYLNDDLPVCMQTESDSWESDFLQQLGEEEEQELDTDPHVPKLTNFKKAVQSLIG